MSRALTHARRGEVVRRLAIVVAIALGASCSAGPGARYSRAEAQTALEHPDDAGLIIGEFPLAAKAVTDGDTIRVDGLDRSLRLLGMDCEETFKKEKDRRDAEAGFEQYLIDRRGHGRHPVKVASPMGEEAKTFAKAFFGDVTTVRLERDHPREIRDRFDRYLAYAFALKQGVWLNYNVEAVRAGMSPYFTKYGYSRRFHADFVAAEAEARAAHRGIFDPAKQHARDYDERKAWWDARAEFVAAFEREAQGRDDYIDLTTWDALHRLGEHLGEEVIVLSSVGDVRGGGRGPIKVMLSRRRGGDLPLIFFDKEVFAASQIALWKGELVTVRAKVSSYRYQRTGRQELQLVVNKPEQITLSSVPGLDPRVPAPAASPTPTPTATPTPAATPATE